LATNEKKIGGNQLQTKQWWNQPYIIYMARSGSQKCETNFYCSIPFVSTNKDPPMRENGVLVL
jgi:hypothetical protein